MPVRQRAVPGAALVGDPEALHTNLEEQVALAAMRQRQTRPTLTIS
ncbi:MAG: hypothetical protein IID31_07200 [Planctomycetes bacterium]|nr:hypothetical protein [Planctomycetota bacterium]